MANDSLHETQNTLQFAERAKTVKNKVKKNVTESPEQMRKRIAELEAELAEDRAAVVLAPAGAVPHLCAALTARGLTEPRNPLG